MHNIESDIKPFFSEIMLREMKAELHELRYYLEQKVEQRTQHLLKRIVFLESCNATLCEKLAASRQELARLRPQEALQGAETQDLLMARHAGDSGVQIQWNEQVSAA